jgi:hypothetical protein
MLCAHSRPGRADGGRCHTNGPQVYYTDATAHSLRHAWWTSDGWHFETLDGPGSTLSGRTDDQVGASVAVTDY